MRLVESVVMAPREDRYYVKGARGLGVIIKGHAKKIKSD